MELNYNPQPSCCEYCNNNPLNNPYASGTCCCSLPYQTTTSAYKYTLVVNNKTIPNDITTKG